MTTPPASPQALSSDAGIPLPDGCTLRFLPGSAPPDEPGFVIAGLAVVCGDRTVASAVLSPFSGSVVPYDELEDWPSLRVITVLAFAVAPGAPPGTDRALWSALIRTAAEFFGAALRVGSHLRSDSAWEEARHAPPAIPLKKGVAWWAPTPKGLLFVCVRPTPSAAQLLVRASERMPEARRLPVKDLHVTLGVLGPLDRLRPNAVQSAWVHVLDLATQAPTPILHVVGVGDFRSPDGRVMSHLKLHSPALEDIRGMLEERMEAENLPLDKSHGFSPHMTVAKFEGGETGEAVPPPCIRFAATSIWLCAGRRQAAANFSGRR